MSYCQCRSIRSCPYLLRRTCESSLLLPSIYWDFRSRCLRATTMYEAKETSIVPAPTTDERNSGAYRKSQLKLKRRFVHVVVGLVPERRNGKVQTSWSTMQSQD